MNMRRLSGEVFFADGPVARVTAGDLAFLKSAAAASPRRRARLCAHPAIEAPVHEMLVVVGGDAYVAPHKHSGRSESFHIIEGRLTVVLFDDEGAVVEEIPMGEAASGEVFFYRLAASRYHTVLPGSEWVVFHEVTNGPFDPAETAIAPWAPGEADGEAQRRFLGSLRQRRGERRTPVPENRGDRRPETAKR